MTGIWERAGEEAEQEARASGKRTTGKKMSGARVAEGLLNTGIFNFYFYIIFGASTYIFSMALNFPYKLVASKALSQWCFGEVHKVRGVWDGSGAMFSVGQQQ